MKLIKILVVIFGSVTLLACFVFISTIVGAIGYGVIFPQKITNANHYENLKPHVTAESNTVLSAAEQELSKQDISDTGQQLDIINDMEVDKGLFSVKMTIPAAMLTDESRNNFASPTSKDIKSTVNSDGSVTIEMSKSKHKEMMNECKKSIDELLSVLLTDKQSYPSFQDIKINDEYTEVSIYTTLESKENFTITESLSPFSVTAGCGLYQLFNGADTGRVIINYINIDTQQIISTFDSDKL